MIVGLPRSSLKCPGQAANLALPSLARDFARMAFAVHSVEVPSASLLLL
jgi:hypothetical protein